MKKITTSLLICTALITANLPMVAQASTYQQFYVSPSGNDSNDGTTQSKPFKTLKKAQEAVRNVNKNMTGDIYVNVAEGTYYLDEMLDFRTEDSGKGDNRVIWRGTGSTMPVISGGKVVSGFADTDNDGIYTADLSGMDINSVYQLSVNGKSRQIAKGATLVYGQEVNGSYYYDDPSIDPDGDEKDSTYESAKGDYSYTAKYPDCDGLYVKKSDLGIYKNIEDMYFLWNRGCYTTAVPVEKIEECSSDSSMLQVTMSYGWYDALTESYNADATSPYANMGFAVMNALELLDEPGEFYFDKTSKKLHYMPVKGENMQKATVVVPVIETLVYIDGNDVTDKATNITFTNLEFTATKWDIPHGFRNGQSNDFSGNGQSAIAPAAIFVERASGITINGCVISNTGAVGINYFNAVDNSKIIGNAFYDIGATAILSGGANHNFSNTQLGESGKSATPSQAQKKLPIDVVAHISTKTTVSSNYGVSNGPVSVLLDNGSESKHIWYNQQGSSALTYPGYQSADDGGWTIPLSSFRINTSWIDYQLSTTYSGPKGVWISDKTAEGTSSPSFVKYEFIRPYSISNIRVGIDVSAAAATESSSYLGGYEVLASNDENFEEYVTFTQVADSDSYTDWTTDSNEKFKYVMIRKTDSQNPLVLSRVWVASIDKTPYVKNQRCEDITVSNNLIDRVGVNTNHSSGIVFLHGSNHTITHNEIKHAGYSGMSIGYSWLADVKTCENMTVQYNRIYDVTRTSYDGGGIYTLGSQPGSIYSHNYIETVNQGANAFYTDNGSSQLTVSNNYVEDMLYTLSPYVTGQVSVNCSTSGGSCPVYKDTDGKYYHYNGTSYYAASSMSATTHFANVYTGDTSALIPVGVADSIRDNTFASNFGTHSYSNDAGAKFNNWQDPSVEAIGLPSRDAYDTYTNAGLEEGYAHLYDLVPENYDNMYEDACYDDSTWRTMIIYNWLVSHVKTMPNATAEELSYLLENGTFGEGLGMYPTSYRAKISNMLAFYKNAGLFFVADTDYSQRHSILKGFRKDLKNAVRRYSLSQTLAMCDELIANAKANVVTEPESGKYPESAISTAEASLARVKAMSQSTPEGEYDKLIAAENVYNTLLASRYGGTIVDVVCDSAVDVEIDNVKDTVTICLPAGGNTTSVKNVNIITDMSSYLAKVVGNSVDLSEGIKVPVTCKNSGKTRMWTIKAKTAASASSITMNDWTAIADGSEFVRYGADFASLAGSPYAYITTKSAGNNTATFKFKPYAPNDTKQMSLLFGIDTCENFYYSDTNNSSDYFELVLSNATATLYSVVNGVKTQLSSGASGINWKDYNTVSYSVSKDGKLTVKLNSTTFEGINAGITGGYAGVYSPTVNVAVK